MANRIVLVATAKLVNRLGLIGLKKPWQDLTGKIDSFYATRGTLPLKVRVGEFEIYSYWRHLNFIISLSGGNYESFACQLYRENISSGMIVVDGGAHIGFYSLLASRLVGNEGKVIAYEPDEYNFKALAMNVKENNCSHNVILKPFALADDFKKVKFYRNRNTVSNSILPRKDRSINEEVELENIQATSIDKDLVDMPIGDSVFIKMDLEGGEPMALEGMKSTINKAKSLKLIIELNPPALENAGVSPITFIDQLNNLGFNIFFADEKKETLVEIQNQYEIKKGNLYCIKMDNSN